MKNALGKGEDLNLYNKEGVEVYKLTFEGHFGVTIGTEIIELNIEQIKEIKEILVRGFK